MLMIKSAGQLGMLYVNQNQIASIVHKSKTRKDTETSIVAKMLDGTEIRLADDDAANFMKQLSDKGWIPDADKGTIDADAAVVEAKANVARNH